jgi:multicomponent Na+:H+ antiporter subunit G
MSDALVWIGSVLALLGALTTVVGAIGVLRFPDFYTRIHAAGVTDTLGATLVLLGLACLSDTWATALKLGVVWLFVMIASPTATHALANAAHASGLKPKLAPSSEDAAP